MGNLMASRAAGYRLAWIVLALLIPIVYLGLELALQFKTDTDVLSKEVLGANFLNIISPVMLDAAAGKAPSTVQTGMTDRGSLVAIELGLGDEFEKLMAARKAQSSDNSIILNLTTSLTTKAGAASALAYDSDPEGYNLAVINSEYLPYAISDFAKLRGVLSAENDDFQIMSKSVAPTVLAIGNLSTSTLRFYKTVMEAQRVSDNPKAYLPILAIAKDMAAHVEGAVNGSLANAINLQLLNPTVLMEVNSVAGKWDQDGRKVSELLRQRLSSVLDKRRANLKQKFMTMLILSFGAIMLGIGSALAMFRTSLKRLDEVEQARDEAESMSAKLANINSEMAKVNSDLAQNMQMLREAQDALVKKGRMEQMGQLTATIAHELRNPLGAVRTSTFLIERKIKGKELGIEPQILRINNGVSRCDDIITQLLDFSRSKKLSCRSENLDLWLEKIVSEEAGQLPAAVSIECQLGLEGLDVPFDPSRLQRAIINLLSNASEALVGKGDDPSKFTTANPCIVISTRAEKDYALISVLDNGPGISADNLEKVREPLFTTKSFGTGLGIPAVEQIISQHGGSLEIQSDIGKGALFILKLPLNAKIEEAA